MIKLFFIQKIFQTNKNMMNVKGTKSCTLNSIASADKNKNVKIIPCHCMEKTVIR